MNQIISSENAIYHICNRGVDQRKIFMDNSDYYRFIHDLFEFNDEENVLNLGVHLNKSKHSFNPQTKKHPRKLLVHILAFTLMPNHYHLLVQPKSDVALSEFMKKLNGGYAKYFNTKYQRTGALFQGKYKAVLIKEEPQFIYIPYYIHANPLDLSMPEWREREISNYKKAIEYLENYRWSSFPDYIGKKNFPSVTNREFLLEIAGGTANYKTEFIRWLKTINIKTETIKDEIKDVGRQY